jgi:hypothetical protein
VANNINNFTLTPMLAFRGDIDLPLLCEPLRVWIWRHLQQTYMRAEPPDLPGAVDEVDIPSAAASRDDRARSVWAWLGINVFSMQPPDAIDVSPQGAVNARAVAQARRRAIEWFEAEYALDIQNADRPVEGDDGEPV